MKISLASLFLLALPTAFAIAAPEPEPCATCCTRRRGPEGFELRSPCGPKLAIELEKKAVEVSAAFMEKRNAEPEPCATCCHEMTNAVGFVIRAPCGP